jgi:hypothetical protein
MSKWRSKDDESLLWADAYSERLVRKTYREERRNRNLHNPKRKKKWSRLDDFDHRASIN